MRAFGSTISVARTATIISSVLIFVCALLFFPYHLTQISKQHSTELNAVLFIDENIETDIQAAIKLNDVAWNPIDSFNLGLNSAPHWLSFTLDKNESKDKRVLLVNYSLLDKVNVWFVTPPELGSDIVNAYKTGDAFPFSERVLKTEKFVFEVPEVDHELRVYIRVSSKGPLNVPLEIWTANSFIEYSSLHNLFLGLFFGFMVAMALSNLYIYLSTQNRMFLMYTAYVTGMAMTIASLHGIGFRYIWPNNVWLQEFAVPIFACLTMIFIISLSISLLDLKTSSPFYYRALRSIRFVFIALLCASVFLPYEIVISSVLVLVVIAMPSIFISGLQLALNGNLVAKYFCGAWSVLLLSGVSIAMENFGFYESVITSTYLVMVGTITEALLLALAIAINVNQQFISAESTRDTALRNEQEAIETKDELIKLQEKNRINLEYSIEERTLELEIALRELSEKNRELEKLSAVDPLTGLMNRRYFDNRILAECRRSKREVSSLGLAMLDIDHFKKINDSYGHLCGDYCLKVFASVLKETIKRPSDIICRYGGEEFVLILPNTSEEGLVKLLEKVRKNMEAKKIMFEGQAISMTVSIGGCCRSVLSEDEKTLIVAFADKQLYQAKESGRNRVMVKSF